MIIIELLILLSTILPIFHLLNALAARKRKLNDTAVKKRFSILIPCYNEEDTVQFSINGLINMDYKKFQAIYINDGSIDETLRILHETLDLIPMPKRLAGRIGVKAVYRSNKYENFFVIDKCNGGKSSALNAGIRFAEYELIVTLDADSVLKDDALIFMNDAFEDDNIAAAGGSVHILQGYDQLYKKRRSTGKKKAIVMLQILEYLKGFYIYKLSLSRQNALAIISGAFGVFRKEMLLLAGGYRNTVGEDIDITIRIQQIIHKTRKKIVYLPEALCYTQCPETWRDLRKQRIRWQKGFIDCIMHHKKFLFKTFLYKSLSFHLLAEAMVIAMSSYLFTIFAYVFVLVLAFKAPQTLIVFSFYYAYCMVFNIVYSLSALAISAKYNRYPVNIMKKAWSAILLTTLFYRYFDVLIYLGGTAEYFWMRSRRCSWNKVKRIKREILSPSA
jgi:cellulose synthase/poly-beta-1,6-N-acetylglucosamine synthase-like glycosyltransferase